MNGWGRVSSLVALGLFVAIGCGGRTSTLLGDGFGPDDGTGADGMGADGTGASSTTGGSSSGGRPPRAGAPGYGGTIGVAGTGVYPGGAPTAGAYGYGGAYTGGAGPTGGYSFGGTYAFGGAYPVAGTGYGGNPMHPAGECCEAHMTASCQPRAVAKCVCQAAPYCCDKQWDAGCARLVEPLGCGTCSGPVNCETCLNRSCSAELGQCFNDFGCLSIFTCMQQTGCQAFQCYSEGWCRDVIDQWGGPAGDSMGRLLGAFTCAFQSGCPCN